ncbi:hypothetical protein Pla52o_15860 [Novipirellula galeiformis]|uniref:Carboxypeptidase regulatory-like domain-containing protein n=1 Tax=Novipirellula galeiformis TaxID=2528004 RepID=A0A5C6CLF5_9BACT|nr:hypothetical protein [Novipirellula galeiformis]TWU25288.1 hypothetical protein Pla52o_15860 [Novipirellula galeiformis]
MKAFVMDRMHDSMAICRGVFALAVVTMLGCGDGGPGRVAVHGTVTLNGESLEQGTIAFIPTGETLGPTTGAQIVNGVYAVPAKKGAVIGMHQVQITSMQKTGQQIEAGPPEPPGTMVDMIEQIVPSQYNTTSTLTVNVKPGENNNVDFALERPDT